MTQVTLICVGNFKESYWQAACREYEKRLSAYCQWNTVVLKEERITDENNPQKIQQALLSEGEKILSHIPDHAFRIALCVEGKSMDSVTLAKTLEKAQDGSGKIALIIGSSHGLHSTVKQACDLKLSVSALTLPHQLCRVLLMETVYRSFTILAGKSYHK